MSWMNGMSLQDYKDLFLIIGTIVALLVFGKGVLEYVDANAIRRYEKFHEMSVRFDGDGSIQKVCKLLNGIQPTLEGGVPDKLDKEVFICFLEEVYFMMKSKIMKRDLALYTFGYYGRKALNGEHSKKFWDDLDRSQPFYVHFLSFCEEAKEYRPDSGAPDLTY